MHIIHSFINYIDSENIGILYPRWQIAYQYSEVKMYCPSLGNTSWTHNDNPVPSSYIDDDNSDNILIQNVTKEDAGNYRCTGHYGRLSPSGKGKKKKFSLGDKKNKTITYEQFSKVATLVIARKKIMQMYLFISI